MGPADLSKPPASPGEVIGGKYRVEGLLGTGGMGVVMAAHHLALDEPVALKFITDARAADRDARGRLMREARATFRLRSPHTVRVLDVGELPSGPLYIVMERLEGRDLKAELLARRRLPDAEVAHYAVQACDALEEAHAMGIVHRDLKPHNMFLAKSGVGSTVLKILDFGMSKVDRELFEEGPRTRPAQALGTPRYMAPEQWKSAAEVDARADVWALGVVMYELLTGAPPLGEMKGVERMSRLLAGAIESPRDKVPEVPETLSRLVMRCLKADPSGRWPSIKHLAAALKDAYPRAGEGAERPAMSTTGITRQVPAEVMKRRAEAAFEGRPAPPSEMPPTRPTMPDSPGAIAGPPSSNSTSEDFEARTEVRGPLITPAHLVATDLPLPALERQAPAPARQARTLRSAVVDPNMPPGGGQPFTVEPTVKMAPGPARELLATAEAAAAAARARAMVSAVDEGPPSVPIDLRQTAAPLELRRLRVASPLPPAPSSLRSQPPPRGPRVVVLVVAGGILSVFALLALGWYVAAALR